MRKEVIRDTPKIGREENTRSQGKTVSSYSAFQYYTKIDTVTTQGYVPVHRWWYYVHLHCPSMTAFTKLSDFLSKMMEGPYCYLYILVTSTISIPLLAASSRRGDTNVQTLLHPSIFLRHSGDYCAFQADWRVLQVIAIFSSSASRQIHTLQNWKYVCQHIQYSQ